MASWKKIIVSGSNAELNHITSSGNLQVAGNISGSATSTGSFGYLEITDSGGSPTIHLNEPAGGGGDSAVRMTEDGSFRGGLAQTLANQQQLQTQQISASIGQQEAANQRLAAQGAMRVQGMEQQAKRAVMAGEFTRQQAENQRQMDLMQLKAGRQQAGRDFRASMQAQRQRMMGGVGS